MPHFQRNSTQCLYVYVSFILYLNYLLHATCYILHDYLNYLFHIWLQRKRKRKAGGSDGTYLRFLVIWLRSKRTEVYIAKFHLFYSVTLWFVAFTLSTFELPFFLYYTYTNLWNSPTLSVDKNLSILNVLQVKMITMEESHRWPLGYQINK